MDFKKKYFKYKSKYLNIKKIIGGTSKLTRRKEIYPSSPETASPPDTPKLVLDIPRDSSPFREPRDKSPSRQYVLHQRRRDRSPERPGVQSESEREMKLPPSPTIKQTKNKEEDEEEDEEELPPPMSLVDIAYGDRIFNINASMRIINQAYKDIKDMESLKETMGEDAYNNVVEEEKKKIKEEQMKIQQIKEDILINGTSITKYLDYENIIPEQANYLFGREFNWEDIIKLIKFFRNIEKSANNPEFKIAAGTYKSVFIIENMLDFSEFFQIMTHKLGNKYTREELKKEFLPYVNKAGKGSMIYLYDLLLIAQNLGVNVDKEVQEKNIGLIKDLKNLIRFTTPDIQFIPENYVISVLENKYGYENDDFQKNLRQFNSVLKLINYMNVDLRYIHLPYFLIKESSRKYYTIEEKVDGDLFDIIAKEHKYFNTNIKRFKIILNLLKCLEILHSNNICHLDIKPENFLVLKLDQENLQIKLTDFDFMENIHSIPHFQGLKGSFNYMDPKVIHKMGRFYVGEQAVYNDLYGIGIIYYLLLYGRFPYDNHHSIPWMHGFHSSEYFSDFSPPFYDIIDDNFERDFISYLCNADLSKRKKTTELIQIMQDKLRNLGIPLEKKESSESQGVKKTLDFDQHLTEQEQTSLEESQGYAESMLTSQAKLGTGSLDF